MPERLRAAALAIMGALAGLQLGAAPTPLDRLDAYHSALLTLKRPAYIEYDYIQTRSGPDRVRTEQHRVYRTDAGQERNDTVMINGTAVVPAISRILRRTQWPYDVTQFAVSADAYDITPSGVALVSGRKAYAFSLARKTGADFKLKGLYVDSHRFLPLRETFAVTGGNCSGDGVISFGAAAQYWLPTSVQVTCTAQTTSGPAVFKESIRFANYGFPNAIPAEIFNAAGPPSAGATP